MTLQSTDRLLSILRANGVTYFKSHDVEIRIGAIETRPASAAVGPEPSHVPRGTGLPSSEQKVNKSENSSSAGDVPVKQVNIPHQVNKMVSVLRMSDEQLVDALFPEGKPPENPEDGN